MTGIDAGDDQDQVAQVSGDGADRNTDLNASALLKAYRRQHGWTVRQASANTGVPVSTWHGWEGGKPMPQHAFVAGLLRSAVARDDPDRSRDPLPLPAPQVRSRR